MVEQKTTQKTVQKTAPGVVHNVMHKISIPPRVAGKWFWAHKVPILTYMAWLGLGTMLGAVRVIPPPAKFIKLGLFRIGTG